ncbi:hypothetical protein LINGRAHAP2_LOCUS28711, partial [Linum grandiflorum]
RNPNSPHHLPPNSRDLHSARNPNHQASPEIPFLHLRLLPPPPVPPPGEEESPPMVLQSLDLSAHFLHQFLLRSPILGTPAQPVPHPLPLRRRWPRGHVAATNGRGGRDWSRARGVPAVGEKG